jgi:bifunctional non-homologous end joining protein LigD
MQVVTKDDSGFPPTGFRPMQAETAPLPREESEWAAELKWDGIRAIAQVSEGGVVIRGRNDREITDQFPEIAPLAAELKGREAVLDGELVAFDESGRPAFHLILHRLGRPGGRAGSGAIAYMIFDLLFLDGHDLRDLPYRERRRRLFDLGLDGDRWRTPEHTSGDAAALLELTRAQGLEGIVLKRLESPYLSGKRHRDWLKVKNWLRQEFVIGGWLPGKGARRGSIGALLLGYYEEGDGVARNSAELVYAGRAGSGFSGSDLDELSELFVPIEMDASPFREGAGEGPPRTARFVSPELVAEVEFHQWTGLGLLRQPVFKGLRSDKAPESVRREDPGRGVTR